MNKWSLSELLAGLHDDIQGRLALARKTLGHPTTKGDASEEVWLEMLRKYLPQRYQAAKAHVVDSLGVFSEQIDVVVFDRQYSPFIFNFQGQTIIPAESVYGAFEAKQAINTNEIAYAQRKVASVRRLHRTSLPIPHAGGTYPAKIPAHILGGLLMDTDDVIARYARLAESQGVAWQAQHGGNPHPDHDLPKPVSEPGGAVTARLCRYCRRCWLERGAKAGICRRCWQLAAEGSPQGQER